MHKREMVLALLALGRRVPFAGAQTGKIPRIAVFSVTRSPRRRLGLRHSAKDFGNTAMEGKNIVIEYRSTEGKLIGFRRLPPNWFVSTLPASLRPGRHQLALRSKPRARS